MNIDNNWIKEKIDGRRGLQARLAEFVGIDANKMAKIMTGQRQIQGNEVLKIVEFFDNLELGNGFAETASDFSKAPGQIDTSLIPEIGETKQKQDTPQNPTIETKIAIKGKLAQISAVVDKAGLRDLRKKIEHIEALMED